MPILDIGGKDSHPVLDAIQVFCAMAYPRDETRRRQYWARFTGEVFARMEDHASKGAIPFLRDLDEGAVTAILGAAFLAALRPHGGLASLRDAPAMAQLHEEMFSTMVWPGSVAGDLLIQLVQLNVEEFGASVNKAVALEKEYLEGASSESGRTGGTSERYIREQWEAFRPAAHLWAAYRLWFFGRDEAEINEHFCPFTPMGFPAFLAMSEEVLKRVSAIRAPGRDEPVLDPLDSWTVPLGYPLPYVTWEPPPLNESQLAVLKRFKSIRF